MYSIKSESWTQIPTTKCHQELQETMKTLIRSTYASLNHTDTKVSIGK